MKMKLLLLASLLMTGFSLVGAASASLPCDCAAGSTSCSPCPSPSSTDQYGDTYISPEGTVDPVDGTTYGTYPVTLGTTASGPNDITNDTTTSTDWSSTDTATDGSSSTTANTASFAPTGESTTSGATAGTDGADYEECDVKAAIMHVLNSSGHWGRVSGLTSIECFGLDMVELQTTSCLERGEAPSPFGWRLITCGSASEIGALEQKVTHNCDYTTYAYEWRNTVAYRIDDVSNGEVAAGTLNSHWVLGNHCH